MKDIQYLDIKSTEDLFRCYNEDRIARMLRYNESIELGRLLLNRSFSTEAKAIDAIAEFYRNPATVRPDPMPCVCPEPAGLRWHRDFAKGEVIEWSHNPSRQPFINAGAQWRRYFKKVETLCGARFRETANRSTDIHIGYDHLDGRGGTLGVTFVPGSGDRLSACGPMCGDILFDLGERWVQGMFYDTVAEHELGHALGLKHSQSRASLLYPSLIALRSWQPEDVAELLRRYPMLTELLT